MGTMANGMLRHKRILAHKALQAYRKATHTDKWASYIWLEGKLGLDQECDRVIALCRKEIAISKQNRMRGVS